MGFRSYDPSSGRWLTRDPIGYAGGLNLYQYCGNDPVNFTDVLGLDPFQDVVSFVGGSARRFRRLLSQPNTVSRWFDDHRRTVEDALLIAGYFGVYGEYVGSKGQCSLAGRHDKGFLSPFDREQLGLGLLAMSHSGGGIAAAEEGAAGAGAIENIPTGAAAQADPVNFETMTEAEREAWKNLRNSIRDNGIKNPVDFIEDPDTPGKFWILDGNHRTQAAQFLNMDTIPGTRRTLPFGSFKSMKDVRGY